jgi:asparagine synthase (glutamine-hydrolysing)
VIGRKKGGFNVPIPSWLRHDLKDYVRDVLSEKRLREQGFFNPQTVQSLVREHADMQADWSRNIWGLLIFSLWYEQYGGERGALGRVEPGPVSTTGPRSLPWTA